MKYCIECGHELKGNEAFCTECGANQSTPQRAPTPPPAETQKRAQSSTPKKPMSKKKKWLFSIAGMFAVVLIGTHLFLSSYFDPMKSLQAMDQAILDNDVEAFVSQIDIDDAAMLDEDSYFKYIKDYEWEAIKNQYIDLLEQNNIPLSKTIFSNNGEKLFDVRQEKKLLIYNTYAFQAEPTKLTVSTNVADTNVTINETELKLEDTESTETASIYPGTYTVAAEAENHFGSFTSETELEVTPSEEREFMIEFEGDSYAFSTDEEEAQLFVNGEGTGLTFAELFEIGPVPYDAEFELHAELEKADGKVMKTDVMTEDDLGWYGFDFYFNEDDAPDSETTTSDSDVDADSLGDMVLDFRDAYESSLNNKDFSLIAPFLDKGSTAYAELEEYVGDLKDTAYHYDFISNEIVNVEELAGNEILVTTNEVFTFTNHLDEQIDYDRTKEYVLVKSGETYKIKEIDYVETNRDY
ncbi:TcaA NTF2-like domain-containing protein [Oceanobacillus indicireducens]|uniref:Membrane-associated protein TcaA n=1 Tax=Oceanobacillus indicireducens TaxID=1004261 RepID=A0A917XU75_9BACI|nr:hypothetical protein [Oceanobacillus indicireducens]GGN52108.1 membrane-associated protein TcaA [Oceanobacillus indicireducens]